MKFKYLLKLELKNTIKKIPQILIGAMALVIIISAIAFCGNKYLYNLPVNVNINIALCVEDDSPLMGYITQMVTHSNSIKEYASFTLCQREDLPKILDEGGAVAGIILQEDAAADIMDGTNTPIQIVFPKNSGFESALVKEIASAVASLLTTAQAGIYASIDFYNEQGKYSQKDDMLERINYEYISMVLFRESTFNNHVLEATGEVSLLDYYVSAAIVLFLMLFAINIVNVYQKYSVHLSFKLINEGVGICKQLFIKYICIIAIYLVFSLIALPMLLYLFNFKTALLLLLGIIIGALSVASLIQIIYELFDNSTSCILFIFLFSVVLAFISGCFIPSLMLPKVLNNLAVFTPIHHLITLLGSIISDSTSFSSIGFLLFFIVINFAICNVIKKIKLDKENS